MTFQKPPVGMLPQDRLDYSAIINRKPLKLPHGARMVVWTITNVEEWDPTAAMPRTVLTPPAGGAPSPDIPNWAWHEYGNRVGFWRMLKVFDEFKCRALHQRLGARPSEIVAAASNANRVHRPRLHPEEHARSPMSARYSRLRGGDREGVGQAAQLAQAWPDRDLGDPEVLWRRLRLCRRLGTRRPAGVAKTRGKPISAYPMRGRTTASP